jgi:phosphate:Na+ symporter
VVSGFMDRLVSAFLIYITIFLFGMTVMKIGFSAIGDKKLKKIIQRATESPIKGVLIGTLLTAVIQSSSAVTVITVGLAAVGLIRFSNTIGIIIGANIGTTFTGLLATIPLGKFHFVLLGLGVILLFSKNKKRFCLGAIFFGLGCLFLAMDGFNTLSLPMRELASVQFILNQSNHSIFKALIIGSLFTGIIQSSSATTMIAMGFLNNGMLTLEAAITLVIGANIGTCVTALLASIGSNWQARWVSYTHLFFNIAGTLIVIPFIVPFSHLMSQFGWSQDVTLAYSGIFFNVFSAILSLPFATRYGLWVERKFS